jgi:hypothetical protein
MLTVQISEEQLIQWVKQLSPDAKRALVRELVPALNDLDDMVDYGEQKMREICMQRGLNWDELTEAERERLIDEMLHEG